MITFKLFGGAIVFAASLILYFELQKYEKEKQKQANGFILLLQYIKKQIACFSLPITEIISRCDKKILSDCGLTADLSSADTPDEALVRLVRGVHRYMDGEAFLLLERFADEFGKTYLEEQLKSCDYYIYELERYKNKIEAEMPKERKIRFALCFSISASIILLLI